LVNYVVEMPTNDEVVNVPLFPMNKIKGDAMPEIIIKYIEKDIVESLNPEWNASDFLVKNQNGLEITLLSKRWRVVKDCRQLNTTIWDKVITLSSDKKLINIVGNNNKYCCYNNLRQGYHNILL
jgi:hypothetical protein